MSKNKGKTWQVDAGDVHDILDANRILIATAYGEHVGGKYTITEETKANARLIAAAPELLESAKNLLQRINVYFKGNKEAPPDWIAKDEMLAAIAKAEGRQ